MAIIKMTSIDIEIAVAKYIGVRANTIVPNVSWGMGLHECDLLIITKAGYGWEVEIKVSKADLIKDKEKRHGHKSNKIKYLYFAIPESLLKYIKYIPERAGIIVVSYIQSKDKFVCEKTRESGKNSNYKFSEQERNVLLRLGCMRVWGLKNKLQKLKRQE